MGYFDNMSPERVDAQGEMGAGSASACLSSWDPPAGSWRGQPARASRHPHASALPSIRAGNVNIAAAMQKHMSPQQLSSGVVVPMATAADIAKWERLGEQGARPQLPS